MITRHTVTTGLGTVEFCCVLDTGRGGGAEASIRETSLRPKLPSGMAVDDLRGVLLTVRSTSDIRRVDFECRMLGCTSDGPETGENLDALSYRNPKRVVTIGTEDGEALSRRYPWLAASRDPIALVEYFPAGMRIPVSGVPANQELSLHFAVAEGPLLEGANSATWFAVDVPHDMVVRDGS